MFLDGLEENGGKIMITCDFVFVVVNEKKGTAGFSEVRFSSRHVETASAVLHIQRLWWLSYVGVAVPFDEAVS